MMEVGLFQSFQVLAYLHQLSQDMKETVMYLFWYSRLDRGTVSVYLVLIANYG